MRNQFSLEISNPCSEKFNQFKKTKQGGFCNSCQKEVVDFTGMSPNEIINYFKQNSNQKTCGQFADFQLTTYIENTKPKKHNYFAKIGLACLSLFSFNTIQAQVNKPKPVIEVKSPSKSIQKPLEKIIVKGTIIDVNDPLPGASVVLEGTTIGVETDFDGRFTFPKPLKAGDVLIISFIGYESKKVIIENNKSVSTISLNVKLEEDSHLLLGAVNVKQVYSSKRKNK